MSVELLAVLSLAGVAVVAFWLFCANVTDYRRHR